MKHKKQMKYLIVALLSLVLCSAILTNAILRQEQKHQLRMESTLPFGDYLPDAKNPLIRVVIKSDGFTALAHSEVRICAIGGLIVRCKDQVLAYDQGELLTISPDDQWFLNGSIIIEPRMVGERLTIHSLTRGYGTPSYRGKMELFSTAEGIVIVNELPLEEYLYAVVPSEMPASYEEEALKCQAVCARSYAYCQMQTFAYPAYQAHVDDSVSFQVYGNSGEYEATTRAVLETKNKKLWYQNRVVKAYYYSTSCGYSTDLEAWGTQEYKAYGYLQSVSISNERGEDYEKNMPWYRWKATVSSSVLHDLIEFNTKTIIGELQNIEVTKRGRGGVALELTVYGSQGFVTIKTENQIRRALGGSGYTIEKGNGTVVNSNTLLPSAFFEIAKQGDAYLIEGGGYGHGIGMSQNGANEMAKSGKNYEDILEFFYSGAKVE